MVASRFTPVSQLPDQITVALEKIRRFVEDRQLISVVVEDGGLSSVNRPAPAGDGAEVE